MNPEENPDDGELSPFDDPDNIFYVDPKEKVEELSMGDTQEFTLEDIQPHPAETAVAIALNKLCRDALIECVKSSLRIISTYQPDDENLEDGQYPEETRLLAYYKKEIAHHLAQSQVVTRKGMLQKLKEDPAPGFPNFDEELFQYAYRAIWEINDNFGL